MDSMKESEQVEETSPEAVTPQKSPRSKKKLTIDVDRYFVHDEQKGPRDTQRLTATSASPDTIEFTTSREYSKGTILEIFINLPEYWPTKRKMVQYSRIDEPTQFKVLAKVIESEDVGKRKSKRNVVTKVVSIDEVDEKLLSIFLGGNK